MPPLSLIPKQPTAQKSKDEPLLPDDEFKAVLPEIGKELERLEGRISEMREHSVSTHLKGVLRLLGFKPHKDWKEGDYIGLHKIDRKSVV